MINLMICLECTSSMTSYLGRVRQMLILTLWTILGRNQNAIRMSVIQFPSRERHDQWLTNEFTSTQDINIVQQWLNNIEAFGGSEDECEAVGDALQEALNLFQISNSNNGGFDKKLVILITDGAPNGLLTLLDGTLNGRFAQLNGVDPWLVADEFNRQGITLAVVGVESSILPYDDFYCALAFKTGGHYIPLINAAGILTSVIQSVILEGYTFRQAFQSVQMNDLEQNSLFKYSTMKQRVNAMISTCGTIFGLQKLFFNYRQS